MTLEKTMYRLGVSALLSLCLTSGAFAQNETEAPAEPEAPAATDIADSLDMLADSFVYGLSLLVIGKAMSLKRRIARLSGYTQLALASAGVIEVVRRFIGNEAAPDFVVMATVASLALSANVLSLFILARTRDKGVHLQASWIFTSNDVIANLGVIVAALLVYVSGSKLPDLIVGILIFAFVGYGALRILRLAKS